MAKNNMINYYNLNWKDFDCNIYQKNFSEMYENLTKKIVDMFKCQKENKYKYILGITTPGIDTAVLVNKIASKYGSEFKVIAVKDDFRFKFPEEYINGNVSDYEKLIGCSYHDLYNGICDICFFTDEMDPAEQLRAGLIKR